LWKDQTGKNHHEQVGDRNDGTTTCLDSFDNSVVGKKKPAKSEMITIYRFSPHQGDETLPKNEVKLGKLHAT
jgi:hypothetical protein